MWRKFCGFLLRALGWTAADPPAEEEKCIILGVPHTSTLDFLISYLYYESVGGNAKCMIKKQAFFPPLGWILRAMGGIPVDRSNPASMLKSVIDEMAGCRHFHLAIAPEGTRKAVRRWKTGYHLIASKAGIPVYMGYFDWHTKRVGRGRKVELTGDAREDTDRIQSLYEQMHLGARHPERYTTR